MQLDFLRLIDDKRFRGKKDNRSSKTVAVFTKRYYIMDKGIGPDAGIALITFRSSTCIGTTGGGAAYLVKTSRTAQTLGQQEKPLIDS